LFGSDEKNAIQFLFSWCFMESPLEIQYVTDAAGHPVSVIVPIELWHEIESERETAYLLKSEAMKKRLLAAKDRQEGISLNDARAEAGI
jgi:antitoxin YefM